MEDDIITKILDEVTFERQFYQAIADTEEYDVVCFDALGREPLYAKDEIQRRAIEAQCERSNLRVLYRISYGDYAVVVCKDDVTKVGIIPETNPNGWEC